MLSKKEKKDFLVNILVEFRERRRSKTYLNVGFAIGLCAIVSDIAFSDFSKIDWFKSTLYGQMGMTYDSEGDFTSMGLYCFPCNEAREQWLLSEIEKLNDNA